MCFILQILNQFYINEEYLEEYQSISQVIYQKIVIESY